MLGRLRSLTPRQRNESHDDREARLEKRRSRSRKADPIVPFSDPFSSPRPEPKEDVLIASPKAKPSSSPTSAARPSTPPSTAKKPRLCRAEDNPFSVSATPPSSVKREPADRGAGVGLVSPPPSSSKKARMHRSPQDAKSPPPSIKRALYPDMASPGGGMQGPPADSGPASGNSAMELALRGAAAADSNLSASGAFCNLPDCPELSVKTGQGIVGTSLTGTPAKDSSMLQNDAEQSDNKRSPSLPSLQRDMQRLMMEKEDPALRASAPASFCAEADQLSASRPQAPTEPRRPHSARPPARPMPALKRAGAALASAASAFSPRLHFNPGRLMSPRRMMSPGRVMSPRPEAPQMANVSETPPAAAIAQKLATPATAAPPGRAWLPSPRRHLRSNQKEQEVSTQALEPMHEPSFTGAASKASVSEPADPAEALVQPMLSAVYGRPLTSAEVAAATTSCPEITWLAQCALLCPLPVGWRQCPADSDDAGRTPILYACELTGEVGEQPPHLARFSKLARLLLHAVTHPAEAHTAAAWVKVEIEDAHAESVRLQESWCRSVSPVNGAEFWHNPMTGKSSWASPAAPAAYTAAVAERILDTEPFKAVKATEAAQDKKTDALDTRSKSQSAPVARRPANSSLKPAMSARKDTEIFDIFGESDSSLIAARPRKSDKPLASGRRRRSKNAERFAESGDEPLTFGRRTRSKHVEDSDESLYQSTAVHSGRRHKDRMSARGSRQETSPPATPQAVHDFACAEEEFSDVPGPEVFNMATPKGNKRTALPQAQQRVVAPQPQPVYQTAPPTEQASQAQSTDCAIALAGAAAALATAAAALSARGLAPANPYIGQPVNYNSQQSMHQQPPPSAAGNFLLAAGICSGRDAPTSVASSSQQSTACSVQSTVEAVAPAPSVRSAPPGPPSRPAPPAPPPPMRNVTPPVIAPPRVETPVLEAVQVTAGVPKEALGRAGVTAPSSEACDKEEIAALQPVTAPSPTKRQPMNFALSPPPSPLSPQEALDLANELAPSTQHGKVVEAAMGTTFVEPKIAIKPMELDTDVKLIEPTSSDAKGPVKPMESQGAGTLVEASLPVKPSELKVAVPPKPIERKVAAALKPAPLPPLKVQQPPPPQKQHPAAPAAPAKTWVSVTPAVPEKPAKLAAPAAPAAPAVPAAPTNPAVSATAAPKASAATAAPTAPAATAAPVAPSATTTATAPSAPSAVPTAPTAPVAPAVPGVLGAPVLTQAAVAKKPTVPKLKMAVPPMPIGAQPGSARGSQSPAPSLGSTQKTADMPQIPVAVASACGG